MLDSINAAVEKPGIETAAMPDQRPRWLRDLLRFLPLKSQFVLSGNVRDLQLACVGPSILAAQPLLQVLATELRGAGYGSVIVYEPVGGFRTQRLPGDHPGTGDELLVALGLQPGGDGAAAAGTELFAQTLSRIVTYTGPPIALVADFASRLIVRADTLSPLEHAAFTRALVLSHQARARPHGTPPRAYMNTVIWIADKEGDLPDWFLIGNPRIRHIPVAKPDSGVRRSLAASLLRTLPGYRDAGPDAARQALDAYADATEGLLLVDLAAIQQLAKSESVARRAEAHSPGPLPGRSLQRRAGHQEQDRGAPREPPGSGPVRHPSLGHRVRDHRRHRGRRLGHHLRPPDQPVTPTR